jgi:hypothetical protein
MYIRLGKFNVSYSPETLNDTFMIFSQVVGSQLAYEKPRVISSTRQLDVWFGKDFPEYSYMSELLSNGASLFITKPLQDENSDLNNEGIDMTQYYEELTIFYNDEGDDSIDSNQYGVSIKALPQQGSTTKIYKVIDPDGPYSYKSDYGEIKYTKRVYLKEYNTYMDLDSISTTNSLSANNRDTLVIFNNDCPISHCTPPYCPSDFLENVLYEYRDKRWVYKSEGKAKISVNNIIELNKILGDEPSNGTMVNLKLPHVNVKEDDLINLEANKTTLALKTSFNLRSDRSFLSLLDLRDHKPVLLYYSTKDKSVKDIIGINKENYFKSLIRFDSMDALRTELGTLGYYMDDSYIIAFEPIPVTYFTNIQDLEPDQIKTQEILYNVFKDYAALRFYTKTIGYSPDKMSVLIEKLDEPNNYRLTLRKYDYQEVFEGYSKGDTSNERLDYMISNNSGLMYCELLDPNIQIPKDEIELGGTIEETFTPEMYNRSLEILFNDSQLPFDYFLVPNQSLYQLNPYDSSFSEKLLSYAENLNCQVLIQNTEDDYKFNYTKDLDNRLIYFYKGMTYNNEERPGYYLYLTGLLSDIYSADSKEIIYENPVEEELYEDLTIFLDKYKSNYLYYNGQKYYYKTYLNGSSYNTTGWMRFAISKISREIEKNKWELLGDKVIQSTARTRFERLMNRIVSYFRIIDSITIKSFTMTGADNRLDITIETSVNDLVKNNVTIDLTVNFKQSNTN